MAASSDDGREVAHTSHGEEERRESESDAGDASMENTELEQAPPYSWDEATREMRATPTDDAGMLESWSRTLLAIYENYQQRDGSVRVPEVLRPWVGAELIPARNP